MQREENRRKLERVAPTQWSGTPPTPPLPHLRLLLIPWKHRMFVPTRTYSRDGVEGPFAAVRLRLLDVDGLVQGLELERRIWECGTGHRDLPLPTSSFPALCPPSHDWVHPTRKTQPECGHCPSVPLEGEKLRVEASSQRIPLESKVSGKQSRRYPA